MRKIILLLFLISIQSSALIIKKSGGGGASSYTPRLLIASTDEGQTTTSGDFISVTFEDTVKNDFSSDWSGTVLTNNTGVTKYYEVSSVVDWSAGIGTNEQALMRVYVNGSTHYHGDIFEFYGTADDSTMHLFAIVPLADTETLEIKIYQATGSSKTLSTVSQSNRIYIKEI